MKKNQHLAQRLAMIITQLTQHQRVDIYQLADDFSVSVRTIQRDINNRLAFLDWKERGPRYYQLDNHKLGVLHPCDIERFARFASVSDLFPKIDQQFYQEKLAESIKIKGFEYEDIRHLQKEFEQINQSIAQKQYIHFNYKKSGQDVGKFYKIAPYALVNKNGIWYLIGTDDNKQKTFCFTQITKLKQLDAFFEPNQQFLAEIQQNDSISHGNQLPEVVIKVAKFAAPYFLRRHLLPNQQLVHKLDDGGLLLSCKNINKMDIIPLVQYWIPHLTIISPTELQNEMVEKIQGYLENSN